MPTSHIIRTLFDALGYTGNIYYARFVRKADGLIWDDSNEVMAAEPSWSNSAVAITETGQTGQYPIYNPENLPAGTYDIIIYQQSGSDPANTDDVELQFDAHIPQPLVS